MSSELSVSIEDLGPCRKKVKISVPPARIKKEIEEGIKNAGKYINVPGFRPGHVPRKIVEQRYGPAIRKEVKETLIQDTFREALEEKHIHPLGSPEIDFDGILFDEEKPLEYEFSVNIRPTIELKKYKGIEIKREKLAVAPAEIDEQVTAVRRSRRRPVADNEGKVAEDGFAVCVVEFLHDGKSVLKRDAIRMAAITPIVGSDPEEFKKALIGKKVKQSFELGITFPEDFEVEAVRGKKGKTTVEITDIYKFIEPNDEEMLKSFDFPDMATMRQETEKQILAHKEEMEDRRIENAILDEIIKSHKFDLPEQVVQDQAESALARFRSLREGEGVTGEALAAEVATKQKETRENAEKQVKGFFLIESIGRKEKLFVTDDEISAELQGIAERNQSSLKEVQAYYQQQNLLPMLRLDLLEKKVRRFLKDNAKIV